MAAEIKPWVVGGEAVYVVGLEGRISAIGEDTITIAGHTLPTRLNHEAGVHYLSTIWPNDIVCDREHIDDTHSEEFPERESLAELVDLIRERHEQQHTESQRFCNDSLCRAADAVDAGVLS